MRAKLHLSLPIGINVSEFYQLELRLFQSNFCSYGGQKEIGEINQR